MTQPLPPPPRADFRDELVRWSDWARELLGIPAVYKDVHDRLRLGFPQRVRMHELPACIDGKQRGGKRCHQECHQRRELWQRDGAEPFVHTCWRQLREWRAPVVADGELVGVWMLGPVRGRRRPREVAPAHWEELPADFPSGTGIVARMLAEHCAALAPVREAHAQRSALRQSRHPAIRRALEIIELEWNAKLRAQDVARRVGLSPSQFANAFKASTGTTCSAYLEQRLMSCAARLLARQDLPLRAIADRLGYSTPSYFTRAFKRHYGETPSAYREQMFASEEA